MLNNPAVLGVIRGLGVAVLAAIVHFIAVAANLEGVVSPQVAAIIAAIALGIEHNIESKGGGSLFGAVKRS